MADTNVSHSGRSLLRLGSASLLALVLSACSGLPTAPKQPVRYDLGMVDLTVPVASAAAASGGRG